MSVAGVPHIGNSVHIFLKNELTFFLSDFSRFFRQDQCDQIGQNSAIWATLGDFLPNGFSPKQAVSAQGVL
jgi:hypothetical protein